MPEVMTKSQPQISQPSYAPIAVLIVAAGRGSRAGEGAPKQYRRVAGKTILSHTLNAIKDALPEAVIQVVIHPDDADLYNDAVQNYPIQPAVFGGSSRQESVFNGISALKHLEPEFILVHDAARPFVDTGTIHRLIGALKTGAQAVLPATKVTDTLKSVTEGTITHTVDRERLYAVQTPQAFSFENLLEAHSAAIGKELTDDGAVMEASGFSVQIVEGNAENFKITTAADFVKAEQILMMQLADVRVGSGYDVHRFEDGDHVWLCGVRIPFTKSLKGHSDADVGLHALTDALLASIADGDIGQHFPPSDAKWRGASSDQFLTFARDRVRAKGGVVAHVSVCIICEKPKVGPHNPAMRSRVAELLLIDVDRVSIQATTTEKLGFTGREEGIAAQATATIRLPLKG